MNEELAERYATDLIATIGHQARMISYSKSGYHRANPRNLAVFNANVVLTAGKIWHGDLDLTLDEAKLAELSARIGEIVYVLYEHDARFENEDEPLLDDAVYSVTPSGHSRFDYRWHERDTDGMLRRRPPEPGPRGRLCWRVILHRPRLLRFWQLSRDINRSWETATGITYPHLRVGARDNGRTPLLVFELATKKRLSALALETTWYPAHHWARRVNAPNPLLRLRPHLRLGPLRLWMRVVIWPGLEYELYGGYELKRRHGW